VKLTEACVRLVTGDELLVSSDLKTMLETLDPKKFQQVHRSYVVNLDQVEKATPLFNGNFELVLKDAAKTRIPLASRYADKLKTLLKW
jgi:two-component system, LytTR family, response regulator LytT